MERKKKILVTIDSKETSAKIVTYLAEMINGTSDVEICLFHIIAPIPAELREHGGSENPAKEVQLSQELQQAQARWIDEKRKDSAPILEQFRATLIESGVPSQSITVDFLACMNDKAIDTCILETAHEWGAGTIVIGWDSFPWFEELVKTHFAERLLRKAKDLAIWVVKK